MRSKIEYVAHSRNRTGDLLMAVNYLRVEELLCGRFTSETLYH